MIKKILLLVVLLSVLTACDSRKAAEEKKSAEPAAVSAVGKKLVIPTNRAYTGAYIDFGETEDNVKYDDLVDFEKLVGKHQAVIGFSSYWGRQDFPKKQLEVVANYGAFPMIYWNPWDRPYHQENQPDKFNIGDIAEGKWDSYIDMWAKEAKAYNRPMLVSWGLEMNGTWFPWSGFFYGGGTLIPDTNPPKWKGPELFKKAYKHVVDRARAAGADNILWVFHPNNTSEPNEPWNKMVNYWPGSEYADWLALSAYGQQYPGPNWTPFEIVLPEFYKEIMALAPEKPFILAEWGVGEFPNSGNKGEYLEEAMRRLETEFPQLKAAVFWHERWQNGDLSYSNLRVNSSPGALEAYRKWVARPFWLASPEYK